MPFKYLQTGQRLIRQRLSVTAFAYTKSIENIDPSLRRVVKIYITCQRYTYQK